VSTDVKTLMESEAAAAVGFATPDTTMLTVAEAGSVVEVVMVTSGLLEGAETALGVLGTLLTTTE
jgi:hypothetical protein